MAAQSPERICQLRSKQEFNSSTFMSVLARNVAEQLRFLSVVILLYHTRNMAASPVRSKQEFNSSTFMSVLARNVEQLRFLSVVILLYHPQRFKKFSSSSQLLFF